MKLGRKRNSRIEYGDVDATKDLEGWEDPRNYKWRITCWLDGDIYDELRRRAKKGEGGGKYQTLMNEVLRKALLENPGEPGVSVSQLKTLVKDLERGYNPFAPPKRRRKKGKAKRR